MKNSFARVGTRVWNSIPKDVRLIPKQHFKKSIHQKLLDILVWNDNYVGCRRRRHPRLEEATVSTQDGRAGSCMAVKPNPGVAVPHAVGADVN